MRRGAEWAVLLAIVSLVLAAWVTTSSETPVLHGAKDVPASSQLLPESTAPPTSPAAPSSAPEDRPVQLTTPLLITNYVLLILAAIALLMVVWHKVRARRVSLHTTVPHIDALPDDIDSGENLARSLTQIATTGLSTLAEGSPRNAIVRCWLALEQAVEEAGLARDPTLTSAEFTAAVLARYSVRNETITALGALYREARFSEHELTEVHRQRAMVALDQLRSELHDANSTKPDVGSDSTTHSDVGR
jgi:uncharacterized protein DUF4129